MGRATSSFINTLGARCCAFDHGVQVFSETVPLSGVNQRASIALWSSILEMAPTMTRSIYRVDPVHDLPFAREFMHRPVGRHSAGLQRILNVFRGEPLAGKYVLVEVEPHRKWQLARLTGNRGEPIPLLNVFFSDLLAAEREVFKLRWKEHTGEDLTLE